MLPKENRLTTTFEFNKVRRLGEKSTGRFFHIFYLQPKDYEGPSRVGIVISNKFHKKAVRRNEVKRVFRAIVSKNLNNIKGNFWVVIHPKFIALNASYEELNSDFTKVLQTLPISK